MISIQNKDNSKESFEKTMSIFKKKCKNDGFLRELVERRYYVKPSQKRHDLMRKIQRERLKERNK